MKTLELTHPEEVRKVAAWAQLQAIASGRKISKTTATSFVGEARSSEVGENFINSVWGELSVEQRLHRHPPYEIAGQLLTPLLAFKDDPIYVACLFWALYGDPDKVDESSLLFERIACHAFAAYLDGQAIILRCGPDGRKLKGAKEKIELVSQRIGERLIETPSAYNDRGTDIVAWKPFHDERTGKLVLLAQCAAGDNWRGKSREVVLDAWRQYIHWTCKPIAGFAAPVFISKGRWHDIGLESGLVLDRPRLHNLLHRHPIPAELTADAQRWCNAQLKLHLK